MKKLHLIDKEHMTLIEKQWSKEALKYEDISHYAKALFVHAQSIKDAANEGQYYGVLNTGDGCLLLAHVSEIMFPNDHHKTLYCSEFISCPELQFERNTLSVNNRLMVSYSALVKGVMLQAQEKKINKIKIFSPKEVNPHFWNGVLVLFRSEDITSSDSIVHDVRMQGRFALITTAEHH